MTFNRYETTVTRSGGIVIVETPQFTVTHLFPSEKKAKTMTRLIRWAWRTRAYNPEFVKKMGFDQLLKNVPTTIKKK